jgi:hypothetical protein
MSATEVGAATAPEHVGGGKAGAVSGRGREVKVRGGVHPRNRTKNKNNTELTGSGGNTEHPTAVWGGGSGTVVVVEADPQIEHEEVREDHDDGGAHGAAKLQLNLLIDFLLVTPDCLLRLPFVVFVETNATSAHIKIANNRQEWQCRRRTFSVTVILADLLGLSAARAAS